MIKSPHVRLQVLLRIDVAVSSGRHMVLSYVPVLRLVNTRSCRHGSIYWLRRVREERPVLFSRCRYQSVSFFFVESSHSLSTESTCLCSWIVARIRYVASVSDSQLLGSTSTSDVDSDCTPLVYNGTLVLHPCGLIANTLFNDIFTVTSDHTMDETDIAWDSDVADKVSDAIDRPACELSCSCRFAERFY